MINNRAKFCFISDSSFKHFCFEFVYSLFTLIYL
uniref:Uncharacterized protein n=1 Tax=Rhodomela confervoides TaxID=35163 RepID=A0A1Z1MA02_RHOCN|nr:hypothetical protein [Rhodomela confervoides]ARW62789.1 hypothetical protein [Rhodomela confervoides]